MKKLILIVLMATVVIIMNALFTNVTEEAFPEAPRGRYSVAWVDINNNGLQDAFIGPYYFYLNNGDGTFTPKSFTEFTGWGLTNNSRVAFADADNDGYIDMVVTDYANTTVETSRYSIFFKNSGPPDFTFTGQIIYTLPLNLRGGQPMFLDTNGDGKMEIYVTTFGNWTPNYTVGMDQLFRQNAQGGWDNITATHIPQLVNPQYHRPSRGVNACDFDMDFDLDIFVPVYSVGSFNAANFLWVNDGNGHFVDRAAEAGVALEPNCRYQLGLASGAAFGDLNNNGWFDLCVANIHGWAAVYENNKDGTFTNITEHTGLDLGRGGTPQEKQWHSVNWIDHNNNGYLDLWLTQWYGNERFVCFVYENQGPENPGFFVDVTEELGFVKLQEFNDVMGLAAGDYDGDGFLDILFYTLAGWNTEYRGNYLYRNNGNDNNWMQVKLVGDGTNVSKTAVGCQARIFYKDGTASYIKQVESTSSDYSMHQHTLHFGLGKQEEIHQIMVRWLDGRVEYWQESEIGEVNQIITLNYGSGSTTSTFLMVEPDFTGFSDGSAYSPYSSIQQAINAAADGYIISAAPGYYMENIDFSGKNIRIIASGEKEETVLMGMTMGQPKVIFRSGEDQRASLEGFKITGETGIGISCLNSSPTIKNCLITLNNGNEGGGLRLQNSQAIITNCVINGNNANSGGAIYAIDSDVTVAKTIFSQNIADIGSVVNGVNSNVNLTNCLVFNNGSNNNGIITLERGSLSVEFCTITGNSSGFQLTGTPAERGWSILNSIIYANGNNEFVYDTQPLIRYSNTTNSFPGEGNISANPRFSYPEQYDFSLSPFSPCIGAGLMTETLTDITGAVRPQPQESAPDIGCYEHERSVPVPGELYVATTGNNEQGDGTLNNPYKTISYTLANSIGGEKIIVAPGTYNENIIFNGRNSQIVSYYATTGDKSYIENTIINGGAIGSTIRFHNQETAQAGLTGLTITNGRHTNGGGVSIVNSGPTLSNVRIEGNRATANGGGVLIQDARPVLRDVVVSNNNAANFGGGIFIINSQPVLERIDIHKNSAGINGGLAVNNAALTGTHLTIADNRATGNNPQTGGVLSVNSNVNLINSILWGNTPNQTAVMLNGVINIFYSNVQNGFEGQGNIFADPLFLDAESNDYRLEPDSPCIDAGIARFYFNQQELINLPAGSYSGTAPDMGAFDYFFTDIEDNLIYPSTRLSLYAAPNPFNPSTTIFFNLSTAGKVSLSIYNIKGQQIRELIKNDEFSSGNHYIIWEGKDDNRRPVASGVYLVKLTSNQEQLTTKLLMLK